MPHNDEIEGRVKNLESRMNINEERLSGIDASLRGTLDGKPGALSRIEQIQELTERNTATLEELALNITSLRLDRSKVVGIILAVSACMGLIYKMVLK